MSKENEKTEVIDLEGHENENGDVVYEVPEKENFWKRFRKGVKKHWKGATIGTGSVVLTVAGAYFLGEKNGAKKERLKNAPIPIPEIEQNDENLIGQNIDDIPEM